MLIITDTPRLILRTWQLADVHAFSVLLGQDPATNSDMAATEPGSIAETELWRYQAELDKRGWSRWAVVYKETNQLIGYCGFSPYGKHIEMSWRFMPEFRDQGLVLEAIEAVTQFGFNQLGMNEIISYTASSNEFAQGVMVQLGMEFDRFEGWSICTVARYRIESSA
ncbi:MAG: GNAT family N-acetyltransferase [Endozoicomonas sp.]